MELLIKRKSPALPSVVQAFSVALAILSFLVGMGLSPFLFLLTIVFGILAYFAHMSANIEYEYLYVDKELSIDIIRAKSKRKKAVTIDIQRMEVFAPAGSHRLDEYKNRTMKVRDYSSHMPESHPYALIYNGDNEVTQFILEGSEELTKCLKSVAPRKVFTD